MPEGRTFQEEQEAVSGAVVSVMHTLMSMASDSEQEPPIRLMAAETVLNYAANTASPEETMYSEDEVGISPEGGESESSC